MVPSSKRSPPCVDTVTGFTPKTPYASFRFKTLLGISDVRGRTTAPLFVLASNMTNSVDVDTKAMAKPSTTFGKKLNALYFTQILGKTIDATFQCTQTRRSIGIQGDKSHCCRFHCFFILNEFLKSSNLCHL